MARTDYVPRDDAGKCALFIHVRDTLPTFFAPLGILATNPRSSSRGPMPRPLPFEHRGSSGSRA